jgi:integrase
VQVAKSGKGWRARIRAHGKDVSKSFRTKTEAQAWAVRAEAEAQSTHEGVAPIGTTFGVLVEKYRNEITPSKRGSRSEILRLGRILGLGKSGQADPLAEVRLDKINATDVVAWRDRRLKAVSPASVLREWNTLSAICTWAIKELNWLKNHPMKDVRRPETPESRTRRVTPNEIELICRAAGYTDDGLLDTATARTAAAFLFAIETAMRAGEIVGLEWRRVDIERRIVFLDKTKNGTARTVPLSRAAIALIERLRGVDEVFVFGLRSDNLDVLFRKLRDRSLITDLHFHDTRREALTRLAAKVDVMTLAKISGHMDLRILQKVYYAPDMSDIAARLD